MCAFLEEALIPRGTMGGLLGPAILQAQLDELDDNKIKSCKIYE